MSGKPLSSCDLLYHQHFVGEETRNPPVVHVPHSQSQPATVVLPQFLSSKRADSFPVSPLLVCFCDSVSCSFIKYVYLQLQFHIIEGNLLRQYCCAQPLSLHQGARYFQEAGQFSDLCIVLFYFCFSLLVALYMCKYVMCLISGFNSESKYFGFQSPLGQKNLLVRGGNFLFQLYCSLIK